MGDSKKTSREQQVIAEMKAKGLKVSNDFKFTECSAQKTPKNRETGKQVKRQNRFSRYAR